MGTDEMVVRTPPFDMQEQMFGVLSQRPGLSHQRSNTSTDGQIDPFNESRLDELGKAIQLQERIEIFSFTPKHTHDGES